jgi:hypothetical protein
MGGKGRRGSRRCGAAAFAAPFGRKPYGAASCRARFPRYWPQPVPALTSLCRATRAGPGRHARARRANRRTKATVTRTGTPRIVRGGPSSVKGTRRSFLTASQKGSPEPTLDPGASADPADLTARARPEARPEARAANLRKGLDPGFACLTTLGELRKIPGEPCDNQAARTPQAPLSTSSGGPKGVHKAVRVSPTN